MFFLKPSLIQFSAYYIAGLIFLISSRLTMKNVYRKPHLFNCSLVQNVLTYFTFWRSEGPKVHLEPVSTWKRPGYPLTFFNWDYVLNCKCSLALQLTCNSSAHGVGRWRSVPIWVSVSFSPSAGAAAWPTRRPFPVVAPGGVEVPAGGLPVTVVPVVVPVTPAAGRPHPVALVASRSLVASAAANTRLPPRL